MSSENVSFNFENIFSSFSFRASPENGAVGGEPATGKNIPTGESSPVRLNPRSELPENIKNKRGEILEGRVVESRGENEYLIEIQGHRVVVETDQPLQRGDQIEILVGDGENAGRLFLVGLNPSQGGVVLNTAEARELLAEPGLPATSEGIELVKFLAGRGKFPGKSEFAELLANFSLLVGEDNELSFRRVKSFLFLKQNDIPVSKKLLRFLEAESSVASRKIMDERSFFPRLDPAGERLAARLQEVISRLGIDLERLLAVNPEAAGETVRARLAGVVMEMINSKKLKLGAETESENFGGTLRHSLASAVDSESLYLLVPFQAEEGASFFQVQFKDERTGDEEPEQEKWSVTLKVQLSRLGEVVVKARRRDEKLKVNLAAARPEAEKLLRKNKERLQEMLVELDYKPAINCSSLEKGGGDLIEENLLEFAVESLHRLDLEA